MQLKKWSKPQSTPKKILQKSLLTYHLVTSLASLDPRQMTSKPDEHPLDSGRELFLSLDYCHIMKNIRSQFLEVKRLFRRNGKFNLPDFLRLLYKIQEKQDAFKLVRCLTKKHLWPTNLEKMNVNRAVQIFSPQVTTVLRFLQQHGQSIGAPSFGDCLPTVEFMELVRKWFVLHNIKSTTLH
ncbi:hypothetical protein V5799_004987 [Amblyomma americanum]|uniref:Transposable element P transposase-like GTP-binding insertion domain-containing protein n=1 Tax=Amblyomma americanum TaxID=6943 RepID=A0AAQ4D4J3_AMBAM